MTVQQQRDVLNTRYPDLRRLDLEQIFPHLCQQRLLSYSEQEKLKNDRFTTHERIDDLVKWIPKKGTDALARFIKCLENSADGTGHGELASSLKEEVGRIRSKQQHSPGFLQSFKGNYYVYNAYRQKKTAECVYSYSSLGRCHSGVICHPMPVT